MAQDIRRDLIVELSIMSSAWCREKSLLLIHIFWACLTKASKVHRIHEWPVYVLHGVCYWAQSEVCSEHCLLPKQRVTTSQPFQWGHTDFWDTETTKEGCLQAAPQKGKPLTQHTATLQQHSLPCDQLSLRLHRELVSPANGRFDASPPCTLLNCFSGVNPSSAELPDLWKCSVQAGHFLTMLQSFREHICSFPCLWVEAALLVPPEQAISTWDAAKEKLLNKGKSMLRKVSNSNCPSGCLGRTGLHTGSVNRTEVCGSFSETYSRLFLALLQRKQLCEMCLNKVA